MVLYIIKDIQDFNTMYTSKYPLLIIHFMTKETYWNWKQIILMKIHKYANIFKVIWLNYNPYNSCNHISKSWGCRIYACTQSPWLLWLWMHPYQFGRCFFNPADYEFCVHNTCFNFYCFIWGPISSGIKENLTNNIEND